MDRWTSRRSVACLTGRAVLRDKRPSSRAARVQRRVNDLVWLAVLSVARAMDGAAGRTGSCYVRRMVPAGTIFGVLGWLLEGRSPEQSEDGFCAWCVHRLRLMDIVSSMRRAFGGCLGTRRR